MPRKMTVCELIEQLQDFPGETEIRIAYQPDWPLVSSIRGLWQGEEDAGDEDGGGPEMVDGVVYIVEGQQLGYGDKRAWNR